MKKYWSIYLLYWQEGFQLRATFITERFRSLVVLLSFYYLWSALLAHRSSFAGYDRSQMITYILGMNILRSLVFAGRADEISYEINRGVLSGYLLKPVNFFTYALSRDLSDKSINLISAVIEVLILSKLLGVSLAWPQHWQTWVLFTGAVVGAILLNFLLSFILGCWGFWTAESGGPRFFLSLILEFSAGAFFPLDVLSPQLQNVLKKLPSPYLVFFPLNLFLEKMDSAGILEGLAIQFSWIIVLAMACRVVWIRGLRVYSAQGS